MDSIIRLYAFGNKPEKKTINIEDGLYEKLMKYTNGRYDASFSQMINICIENYIENNDPTYYEKPKLETVTYRSIMIRKENLENLQKMHKKTGISVTRLLNAAIKDFLEKHNK